MPTTDNRRGPAPPSGGDDASRRVMDALRRIVRALSAGARGGAARGGVSGAQAFVLRQVHAAPGLTIGELAARTFTGQSAVSEVVARLVARGLVARRPGASDARQTTLTATDAGRRAIRTMLPTAQEEMASALGALMPAERRALANTLDKWLLAAGLATLPATMFFEEGRAGPAPSGAGSHTRSHARARSTSPTTSRSASRTPAGAAKRSKAKG